MLEVKNNAGVVTLTLNRPEKRNALSLEMLQKLIAELGTITADESARVVVLAANGPVFCSGHDLKEMPGATEDDFHTLFATCSEMMMRLRKLPQPVIAKVNGMATAAGCQLVAACDLAVASENAMFATPGVKIGMFCTTPMVPLVRNIAAKPAMEMLLTGNPLSAEQALHAGLVNRVVPEDSLDEAVQEFTDAILKSSPLTIRIGKQAFYEQLSLSEDDAYQQAVNIMTNNAMKDDAREGISAFLEKRTPVWTGK